MKIEIGALKKQISLGGGKSITVNAVPGLPEPQVSISTVSKTIRFEVLECKRKSGVVECIFRVTNTGDDFNFEFYNSSRAFDEFGKEYKPGLVAIADVNGDLSGTTGRIQKLLISRVPVRASMEFRGVPKESTQFTALNINSYYHKLKLRNIAIK